MRREILLILSAILLSGFISEKEDKKKISLSSDPTGIEVLRNDFSQLHLEFTLSSFSVSSVYTPEGEFSRIAVDGYTSESPDGTPELPLLSRIIEIPAGAQPEIHIISFQEEIITLEDHQIYSTIFPSQPSVRKNQDPNQRPFHFSKEVYERDRYTEGERISIIELGHSRGRRLAQLQIAPFQYNPVQNVLKVARKMEIEIRFKNANASLTHDIHKRFYSPVFEQSFQRILNYQPDLSKSLTSQKPLKYVILSSPLFAEVLQPFIEWKTKKGFTVIEAYKGDPEVGSTKTEMTAFLDSLYTSATPEDPAPTYLLIVGDHEQIPAFKSDYGHYTDLYYSEYDGDGDFFPELLYGRLSAKDTSQLNPQIEKILEYEQYLFPDPAFLDEAVMIAGVDWDYAPTWGNGHINYGTSNYLNSEHGILSHTYLYYHDSVPVDKELILQNVSDGAGFVNYTGHGSVGSWLNPSFTISDIETLLNGGKYPLMIGNGCQSANFYYECFGEALVRARGKGALSYIGCTNDSYWDEDYFWAVGTGPIVAFPTYEETGLGMYDRTFHDHGEPETEWYPTQGQMVLGGNLSVVEGSPIKAKYYFEIYHILGDPSLMVYFSQPDPLVVNKPQTVPAGINTLFIQAEPYAYVGITKDGSLLDAKFTEYSGLALLQFQELNDTGKLDIVISKQNRQPYIDSIRVIPSVDPFVVFESLKLCDTLGMDDSQADYGETIVMKVRLENLGENDAQGIHGVLSTSDPYVSIIDSTGYCGTVNGKSLSAKTLAFVVEIRDTVPDAHSTTFCLIVKDTLNQEWISYFMMDIYSPLLETGKITVNDLAEGNGNLKLDPGETSKLVLDIQNKGNSEAKQVTITLRNQDGLITFTDSVITLDSLLANSTEKTSYPISVNPSTESGSLTHIQFFIQSSFTSFIDSFSLPIGLIYEDFENYGFGQYNWYNDSIHPWLITESSKWEGEYSAQSANISHNDTSVLSITIDVLTDDTISFYKRVSSESNYDYLKFYIDTLVVKWSGEKPWSYEEFPVSAGTHTFKWIYSKDVSVSKGYDKAWIDFVVFPRNSFTRYDVGLVDILSPVSGIELTDNETVSIKLKNFGNEAVSDIPITYQLNSYDPVTDTIKGEVQAGSAIVYDFTEKVDLSNHKEYFLTVCASVPSDEYPGNNKISQSIKNFAFIDAGIESILAPSQDSEYSDAEEVTVLIRNFGYVPVSDFWIFYTINNSTPVGEFITNTITAGSSLQLTFTEKADLSAYQSYTIVAFTLLLNDVASYNDSSSILLVHSANEVSGLFIRTDNFLIYPNPTTGVVRLYFEVVRETPSLLSVRNIVGQVVRQQQVPLIRGMMHMTIDLGDLPAGLYFLSFEIKNQRITRKILKE